MQRFVYFAGGLLLIVAAVYLPYRLVLDRDFLILAFVSPFILGGFAYGLVLAIRSFTTEAQSTTEEHGDKT